MFVSEVRMGAVGTVEQAVGGVAPVGGEVTSTERLEAEVCTLAGQLAAGTCRWLLLVGELDRRRAWATWGCASMAQWLSWKCGLGVVAGRQHVRVARALERLPQIRDRFAAGVLSYSKVRALTRIATAATEGRLVELAEVLTASQLERTVRTYERVTGDPDRLGAQLAARTVQTSVDDDGTVVIIARLPRDAAETVITALEAALSEVPTDPDHDSAEARRADALELLAQTYLAGRTARPPTEMVVHVDAAQLTDPDRSPLLERLACDTGLRVVAHDDDDRPATAGRRTRTIPVALRRNLDRRDQGCRFPGCTHRRFLHVHHRDHWIAGGATDTDNCLTLCSFHHRLLHEGGWRILGDSAESRTLTFVGPYGRTVSETPVPVPPIAAPLPVDPAIDARTITTADGGRLDMDHAITALVSMQPPLVSRVRSVR